MTYTELAVGKRAGGDGSVQISARGVATSDQRTHAAESGSMDLDQSANFNIMEVYGPRSVHPDSRRVCLPKALAVPLRLVAGAHAWVGPSPSRSGELIVAPAAPPADRLGRRDLARPRRVTNGSQLTLPAALMAEVGLNPQNPWVYFARDDQEDGVRIIPSGRVQVHVNSGASHE